jgi:hypothetical protein
MMVLPKEMNVIVGIVEQNVIRNIDSVDFVPLNTKAHRDGKSKTPQA